MILHADCLDAMCEMGEASVDAIVTDPPAGISFMGREWDSDRSGGFIDWLAEVMAEALRVTKPGGHALVWALPRTSHWTGMACEKAGWEIRDRIAHHFGSGFPKSLDVSKAIDKARTEDREPTQHVAAFLRDALKISHLSQREFEERAGLGFNSACNFNQPNRKSFAVPSWDRWLSFKEILQFGDDLDAEVWRLNGRKGKPGESWDKREITGEAGPLWELWERNAGLDSTPRSGERRDAPATSEAAQWQGWGTALKPATEDWWLCRKPLIGTIAQTVQAHGTGALNIDATRIGGDLGEMRGRSGVAVEGNRVLGRGIRNPTDEIWEPQDAGRWPANVTLDPEAAAMLDEQSGERVSGSRAEGVRSGMGYNGANGDGGPAIEGSRGGSSRFFYTAKSSRSERNAGLGGFEEQGGGAYAGGEGMPGRTQINGEWVQTDIAQRLARANIHPTVKPIALMRWLVRLVTPSGGRVLDPFAGSGTTGVACSLEGFGFIGIEREAEYVAIAEARIAWWSEHQGREAEEVLADSRRSEVEREKREASGQMELMEPAA